MTSIFIEDYSVKAHSIIEEVFKANRISRLIKSLKLEWSNRLTSTAGRAYYYQNRIVLSSKVLGAANESERDGVVAHEAAHLVAFNKFADAGHGQHFQNAMLRAGYEPFIRHKIKFGVQAFCCCEDGIYISHIIASKIRQGARYQCNTCNNELFLAA